MKFRRGWGQPAPDPKGKGEALIVNFQLSIIKVNKGCIYWDESSRGTDGRRETETFADIVEMARLYIITDCEGSFEKFSEWGLIRPKTE